MGNYISSSLTFYDTKIVVEDTGSSYNNIEVMMNWEQPIMSASAAYVTQNSGDILEIGFGMGIASGYIQSHSISSHTIIENHPQVIPKAVEWASGKSNVTIISQSWVDVTGSLGTYDGIFHDTFGDDHVNDFKLLADAKGKSGAKVSYWNNVEMERNDYSFSNISFEQIPVNADSCSYTTVSSSYYMPKVVI